MEGERPLRELIHCLGQSVECIRDLRERNDYAPEAWSRVRHDLVALLQVDDPLEPLASEAYDLAAAQLNAADDHIVGLQVLLLDSDTVIAPYALARAAIEAAGRAFIFLDPALSHRQRAEIALAERLWELEKVGDLIRSQDSEKADHSVRLDLKSNQQRLGSVLRYLLQEGIERPRRPKFTVVFERVLTIDENIGFGPHTATLHSALVHAVPHMLLLLTEGHEEIAPLPMNVGFVPLDEAKTYDLVFAVTFAYFRAVSRQVEAYAWPPSAWERWKAHTRAVLRRHLRERLSSKPSKEADRSNLA